MLRRIVYVALIWLLLTGGTVFVCASNTGGVLRPPPDKENGGSDTGGNSAPIASDGFLEAPTRSEAAGAVRGVDPDGDEVTYRVTQGPMLGSLGSFDPATGQFTYLPRAPGKDSFSYRAGDGQAESEAATLHIVVTDTAAAGGKPLPVQDVAPVPGDSERYVVCLADAAGEPADCPPALKPADVGLGDGTLAVAGDPFAQARRLAAVASGGVTALTASDDAGRTWKTRYTVVLEAESAHLAFHPAMPDRAYAALARDGWTQLLASRDAGRTWRVVAWVPAAAGSRVAAGWPTGSGGLPVYVSDPYEGRVWRITPELKDN